MKKTLNRLLNNNMSDKLSIDLINLSRAENVINFTGEIN